MCVAAAVEHTVSVRDKKPPVCIGQAKVYAVSSVLMQGDLREELAEDGRRSLSEGPAPAECFWCPW